MTHDDATAKTKITPSGAQGTVITGVAKRALGKDSTDAVNASQLYATNRAVGKLGARVNDMGATVGNVTDLGKGRAGMFLVSKDSIAAPTTGGSNFTAIGSSCRNDSWMRLSPMSMSFMPMGAKLEISLSSELVA